MSPDDSRRRAAAAALDAFLTPLGGDARRLADGEWGLSVEAGGWPLHVGVALRDGLLRAQAHVLQAGRADPDDLLYWNRSLPLVRFTATGSGEVYVQGDLPYAAVDAAELDRLLGLIVATAERARTGVRQER